MKKTTSQKGTWGHVGAPPKTVKYPRTRFTVERAVALNEGICELTIRKRIKADVTAGKLVTLPVIKQPKKAVGRPKFCFQLKSLVGNTPAPTSKPIKVKTATVATVKTSAPITPGVTPSVTTPAATAPVSPLTPVVTNP